MKQVQISEELFTRLYAYFLMNRREPLQERIIKDELQAKFDRIQRRVKGLVLLFVQFPDNR